VKNLLILVLLLQAEEICYQKVINLPTSSQDVVLNIKIDWLFTDLFKK